MAWDDVPPWAEATTLSLLSALKERDPYTYGHCLRVGQLARRLAQAAGLNPYEQQILETTGFFHDLGKIGVPDPFLLKPSKLTSLEVAQIHDHPLQSCRILEPLSRTPFFRSTLPGVRHHHERLDGQGYPDRLAGNAIPLPARMILIVDTFDAMTTTRPYRKGMPFEVAYQELTSSGAKPFQMLLSVCRIIRLPITPAWVP